MAAGARVNLLTAHDWAARYAQDDAEILPQNAVVFGQGEADLAPDGVFPHDREQRPDITLYQAQGPGPRQPSVPPAAHRCEDGRSARVRKMIDSQTDPVVFTLDAYTRQRAARSMAVHRGRQVLHRFAAGHGRHSGGGGALLRGVDRRADEPQRLDRVFPGRAATPLRRGARAVAAAGRPPDERTRRHLELAGQGLLRRARHRRGHGAATGTGYSAGEVGGLLEAARDAMPSDAPKQHVSRYFYCAGCCARALEDKRGRHPDLDTAFSRLAACRTTRRSSSSRTSTARRGTGAHCKPCRIA